MNRYYYTYGNGNGSDGGGWTEVVAQDMREAHEVFKKHHPCLPTESSIVRIIIRRRHLGEPECGKGISAGNAGKSFFQKQRRKKVRLSVIGF